MQIPFVQEMSSIRWLQRGSAALLSQRRLTALADHLHKTWEWQDLGIAGESVLEILTYLPPCGRVRILFFKWLSWWTEHVVSDNSLSICLEVRLETLPYKMLKRWLFDLKSYTKAKTFKCPCRWKTIKWSLLMCLGSSRLDTNSSNSD